MSASRGPQKPVYISSAATPGLSKPNTMGPNQTLPKQTQHQPNQILSSKAKEKREKTSPTETAWSSTETKQVMDDLNLREELAKIIRTHIAKTGERHKNESSQCVVVEHRKSDTNIKHKHTNICELQRPP